MNSKLADEIHRKGTVNIDHEKLAAHLTPRLSDELAVREKAIQTAWVDATARVLEGLENSHAALSATGVRVTSEVKRAGDQVGKLRRTVTWHTVGQIGATFLPFALVTGVVFGMAQTLWAAFGLQPILQTVWGYFVEAQEWYWKITIAASTFLMLAAFSWLIVRLGKNLHEWYRDY